MLIIIDTETTGFDPKKDSLIEVAWARYDERHGLVDCKSRLLKSDGNAAFSVNGISPELLRDAREGVSLDLEGARCAVAHNASFDSQWLPWIKPWVCSKSDIEWPKDIGSGSLEKLALAHGIGVMPGHRAIYDVLTLVRTFDRVAEMGHDLEAMITKAMLPKSIFQSKHPFASNDTASKAGFRWDGARKAWCRKMTDDAAKLLQSTYPYNIYKLES